MTIEEQSEQSYTEIGHYVAANDAEEVSLVDTRTGDFTETYREELQRTPYADKDARQMEKLIRRTFGCDRGFPKFVETAADRLHRESKYRSLFVMHPTESHTTF
jgi:hypothetical protein